MKKRYFLFIAIALAMMSQMMAWSAPKRISADSFLHSKKGDYRIQNTDRSYSVMDIQTDALAKALCSSNSIILSNFPTSSDTHSELKLERAKNVFDQNTQFLTQTPNGEKRISAPDCDVFKGKIIGEENSDVTMIFMNNLLFCSINNNDGVRYFLGPHNGNDNEVMLVREVDFYQGENFAFKCHAEDMKREINKELENKVMSTKLLELKVALETDTEFFKAAGGTLKKAQTYAMAIFALMSTIYERELNVTLYVPWYKCWTDSPADPYNCKGNPFDLEIKSRPFWLANHQDVSRDIYQVITSISYGGSGIGYIDNLCGNKEYGYSTCSVQGLNTYPTFTFTYDIYIVSHELGHNLNGQHTHSCFFGAPIDTCLVNEENKGICLDKSQKPLPNPGSILSYCSGTNNSFGLGFQSRMIFLSQNQALMRSTIEKAACVTEPVNPRIAITYPNGGEALKANAPVDITFHTARVTNVTLSYSIDNGAHWTVIKTDLKATASKFTWTTPDVSSNNCLLLMTSSTETEAKDTSTMTFSIYQTKPVDLLGKYYFEGDMNNSVSGGYANILTVEGGVTPTTDRFGLKDSAIAFNGKGYLIIPQADLTNNAITISFWFSADSLNAKRFMIGTNSGPGLNVFEIYYWGQLGCSYYMKGGLWQVWGGSASTNTWYHTVYTYDGTVAKIYVNGTQTKSVDSTVTLVPFVTSIYIGSLRGADPFYGKLDDIRFYNRAITQSEVTELFTEKRGPTSSPDLLSPKDKYKTIEKKVNLSWTEAIDATSYQFQFSTNLNFPDEFMLKDTMMKATDLDVALNNVGDYYWRVKAVNLFGNSSWSTVRSINYDPTAVESEVGEPSVVLYQNEPNPAETATKIRFWLNHPTNAELVVTNLLGDKISYKLGALNQGSQSVEIDLSNKSAGVYFYSLITGYGTITRKMEVIK